MSNQQPPYSTQVGVGASEMIRCEECGRPNAPDRLTCLYCSAALEASAKTAKLKLRKLEPWENGFNVVALFGPADLNPKIDELCRLLRIEADTVASLSHGRPLPIARVESQREAEILADRLKDFGVSARLISDESLRADQPPIRLRKIEFGQDLLVLLPFNSPTPVSVDNLQLSLIVYGHLLELRTDKVEQRKKRSNKIIDENQISSDVVVFDIYTANQPRGWRIPSHGFDFSCLGSDMSGFAFENIKKLLERLKSLCPAAKSVEDYPECRHLLESFWGMDTSRAGSQLTRLNFGRVGVAVNTSLSNARQFTKYSRLQWHLL